MSKIPIRKTAGATARTVPAPVATIPMTQSSLLKPGNLAKFEETWAKIEPLVRRMFTEGGISKSEWQDIFWHVHSMCVWDISQGLALQEKLEEIFRAYIDKEKQFIFKERDNENPVALLRAYVDAWNRFLFYYNYVPLPFGPLEKLHYSSSSGSVGGGGGGAGLPKKLHNDVESGIRQTMIELWVEHIFSEIHSRLVEAAMLLIDGERHFNAPLSYSPWAATGSANVLGNRRPSLLSPSSSSSSMLAPTTSTTTTAALSNVAAHRLIIGIKESCLYLGRFVNDHLFLYRVNYEMVYLVRTETYYRLAGQAFLQEYGILPYMQWVEGRIAEEQERVTTRGYLEEHSLSKVTDSIVKTLIVSVKEQLVEKFPGLLADGDIAMLSRLFSLLARVPPTADGGEGGEGVERRYSTTTSSSSSNDLSGMVTAFREYLIGRGAKELKALEFSSCSRAAGAAAAAVPGTQPPPPRNLLLSSLVADSEAYIEQLLRLFNDATKLIKDAFGGDPRFLTARDMAFNKLINEKCGAYLCGGGGPSGASKMAEKMDVSENNNNNNNNHLKDAMVVEGDRADGSAEGGGESSLAATKSAAAAQQRGRAPPHYAELGGSSRCAELFANYCDMLLRKGTTLSRGLTSDQIEAKLVNVILVLKYVQDRLLFIRLYKAHLTRRLLLDASVDLVCEEQMVGRLRDVGMPADALNSLGRMFSDLTVSEDFNRQFRAAMAAQAQKEGGECADLGAFSHLVTVKVLNSKAWSTSVAGSGGGGGGGGAFGGVGSSTTSALMTAAGANNKPDGAAAATTTAASLTPSVSLPPGVEETLLKVAAFYREKHTSRRLIWHHQFSSGVITFHTDLGASYDLEATAYQAAVLFSWNDRSSEEGQRPEGEQQEDSPMMEQSSEGSSFAPSSSAVLSLEALSLATQLPAVELKRALWSLVSNPKLKTQLLLPANPDGQPLKHIRDITARTKFRLNDKFALLGKNGRLLKRARVNLIGRLALGSLGGAGASSSSSSSSANYANVWADEAEAEKEAIARLRAERADEALLKILKTRKSSDQRALFAEATRLLSQALFVPSGALLTERLQWLLEHGSVRRDEADERLYHYA